MIKKLSMAVAASVFAFAGAAQAALVNGDFEAGLSGWTTTGSAVAVGINVDSGLLAARMINSPNNNLTTFTGTSIPGTGGGGISQAFTLGSAGTLSFKWDFQTGEATPAGSFNDAAYVVIDGIAILLADTTSGLFVGAPGDGFSEKTGYQLFSQSIGAGSHTLAFVVTDVGDTIVDSGLFIDSITTPANVPEPGSLALLGLGLVGVVALRKRKQAA